MKNGFVSCFDQVFDVAVFGAGWAGFAATLATARQRKSALLVDLRGDLVWEAGRAFAPEAERGVSPLFDRFVERVARVGGAAEGQMDGAIAEVLANEILAGDNPRALYHASPIGVEMDGNLIAAVLVGAKSGLRRIVARQWVDATETGTLVRLSRVGLKPSTAGRVKTGQGNVIGSCSLD